VCRERPLPACIDRSLDLGSRPGEHGLDRAITPVAHPALQTMLISLILDKGAVADALDAAAHNDMADYPINHALSPHR
jgi:hypothetical protein